MIQIKNVLVPTDFSEPSEVALRYGKAFSETFGAALHLVHVLDESALVYPWTSPDGMPIALLYARLVRELTASEPVCILAGGHPMAQAKVLVGGVPNVRLFDIPTDD